MPLISVFVVRITIAALLFVVVAPQEPLERECQRYTLAQGSDVVLNWDRRSAPSDVGIGNTSQSATDGSEEAFTRVAHVALALTTPARVLLLGGIAYESAQPVVVRPLLVYDVASDTFTQPKESIRSSSAAPTTNDAVFHSPASRVNHAAFEFENTVFVFGGQNSEFRADVWRLCVSSPSSSGAVWDELVVVDANTADELPQPRIAHSLSLIYADKNVVIALTYGGLSEDHAELDELHLVVMPRTVLSCSSSGSSLRIGWHAVQLAENNTSDGVAGPLARAYHSASTVSRQFFWGKAVCLIIFGGKSVHESRIFGDVWRLCPLEEDVLNGLAVEQQRYAWEQLTPLSTSTSSSPSARFGSAVALVENGRIALTGGSSTFPTDFLGDTWEFNVNATQWLVLRFTRDLDPLRRDHSLTLIPADTVSTGLHAFVFGGRDRYAVVSAYMETTSYAAPYCAPGLKLTLCDATLTYVCVPCATGFYLEDGTRRCLPCPAGTFATTTNSITDPATCSLCAAGTYNTLTGQTSAASCVKCPAGSYSRAQGAALATTCSTCPSGTFTATSGASSCVTCPAGSFSTGNATACTECSAGQWSAPTAAQCHACARGTYTPRRGSAACFPCPRGFVSSDGVDGLTGATQCDACPITTYNAVVASARADCEGCPALMYANNTGSETCVFCPPGFTLVSANDAGDLSAMRWAFCEPCPRGFYSSGAATSGACVPCPLHSYTNSVGTTVCTACPKGLSTVEVGATSLSQCQLCDDASKVFDGHACRSCLPGSFLSVQTQECQTCAPGTFTSSVSDASLTSGCQDCPSMTISADAGATSCRPCPDGSYAMDAWLSCISCLSTYLEDCPVGRNGAQCSGNGECTLRSCKCYNGWSGGDCGIAQSIASTSSSAAVLYFPDTDSTNHIIVTRSSPTQAMASTWAIQISRSGALTDTLTAQLAYKSDASNVSALPASLATHLPLPITLQAGERSTNVEFQTSIFLPDIIGSRCRSLTFELKDLDGASAPAVPSKESDRVITVFLDDANGVMPSGALTQVDNAHDLTVKYYLINRNDDDAGLLNTISVTLDRAVPTRLTVSPGSISSPLSLDLLPLNLRILLDSTSNLAPELVALLPAMLAQVQNTYSQAETVQIGWISINATEDEDHYQPMANVLAAAHAALAISQQGEALNWEALVSRLNSLNASAWNAADGGLRRVVIFLGTNGLTATQSEADKQVVCTLNRVLQEFSVFLIVVLPPGSTTPSDWLVATQLITFVVLTKVAEFPERVAVALATRDSQSSSSPQSVFASLLHDSAGIVDSTAVPEAEVTGLSLPVVRGIVLRALPSTISTASVILTVPGFFLLNISFIEPGPSCSGSTDFEMEVQENAMSGWIGTWTDLSVSRWRQHWSPLMGNTNAASRNDDAPSENMQVSLYADASLLRSARTAIVSLSVTTLPDVIQPSTTTRIAWTRSFAGSLVAPRLDLVLRGYVRQRHSGETASDSTTACYLRLVLVPIDDLEGDPLSVSSESSSEFTSTDWMYLFTTLQVPWEVKRFDVVLDCTITLTAGTSSTNGTTASWAVEWTELGLFPNPTMACMCPRGFFYDAGECVRCPAGSYCVAGIKRACPLGSFSFGKAASCESCRDGWICVNGLVRLCEPGTYASELSTCLPCPPGYACRNGKQSVCPLGTFSHAHASDCQSCPPGTISSIAGAHTCTLCALGSTSNYQRDHCIPCSAGEHTSALGQHTCTSCAATSFLPATTLIPPHEICVFTS